MELLKAGVASKFAMSFKWTEETALEQAPLKIAVYGSRFFFDYLKQVLGDDVQKGITALSYEPEKGALLGIHVIYLAKPVGQRLDWLWEAIKDRPMVVITDDLLVDENLISIRLFVDGKTVKFDINNTYIKRVGLKISSHILNLAHTVY